MVLDVTDHIIKPADEIQDSEHQSTKLVNLICHDFRMTLINYFSAKHHYLAYRQVLPIKIYVLA